MQDQLGVLAREREIYAERAVLVAAKDGVDRGDDERKSLLGRRGILLFIPLRFSPEFHRHLVKE
jgi:hypothetical protein